MAKCPKQAHIGQTAECLKRKSWSTTRGWKHYESSLVGFLSKRKITLCPDQSVLIKLEALKHSDTSFVPTKVPLSVPSSPPASYPGIRRYQAQLETIIKLKEAQLEKSRSACFFPTLKYSFELHPWSPLAQIPLHSHSRDNLNSISLAGRSNLQIRGEQLHNNTKNLISASTIFKKYSEKLKGVSHDSKLKRLSLVEGFKILDQTPLSHSYFCWFSGGSCFKKTFSDLRRVSSRSFWASTWFEGLIENGAQ